METEIALHRAFDFALGHREDRATEFAGQLRACQGSKVTTLLCRAAVVRFFLGKLRKVFARLDASHNCIRFRLGRVGVRPRRNQNVSRVSLFVLQVALTIFLVIGSQICLGNFNAFGNRVTADFDVFNIHGFRQLVFRRVAFVPGSDHFIANVDRVGNC